jgi:Uma2 family endonuclease
MTAEEFFDFVHRPENANRWFELVRGEVIELPPPMKVHGVVSANAARILGNFAVNRSKGYVTSNDSGVILERDPDTVRGPDVAFYEDAASLAALHPKYGEDPPLLAVAVMSPNDKIGRVMSKFRDYMSNGVRLVCLIDPDVRNVSVYRPDRSFTVVELGGELTGDGILPDLRVPVADLFFVPGGTDSGPAVSSTSPLVPPSI